MPTTMILGCVSGYFNKLFGPNILKQLCISVLLECVFEQDAESLTAPGS